jgi:SNF2 family DNA or RNA helicase
MHEHILGHHRCALFADMGLGKTLAVLWSILELFKSGAMRKPVLIIGPLRVARYVWADEIRKWGLTLTISPITGSASARAAAATSGQADIYTVNYENIPWLVEYYGDKWPFGMVVCDESTRLKNHRMKRGTLRAKALSTRAWKTYRECRWVNLTGTPTPNGLIDLWGQTYFLDEGVRLGSTYTAFRDRWFRVENAHSKHVAYVPRPWAQSEITARVGDICHSYEAKDWFDLRAPIVVTRAFDLPAEAQKIYRELEKKLRATLTDARTVTATTAATLSIKSLQLASGAVYTDHDGQTHVVHDEKLRELESVVEEAAGDPLLVVYHFKSDLERLKAAFPYIRLLDGKGSTVDEWNAGKIKLLALHPASAGHGLNLQHGGHRMAFFSHWWDLELYQQVVERIGPVRQMQAGFDRPVYIYHIVARNTIDELVIARRETKRSVQEILMEGLKP